MVKKLISVIFMAAVLISGIGCGDPVEPYEPMKPDNQQSELPAEIESWVEDSLDMFLGQSLEYEGKLYLLVTYGEKPTGGYSVVITDIHEEDSVLVVEAIFLAPGEDDLVTEALAYPYDLVVIDIPGLPVEFIASGAETYLPTLYGLDHLQPITAGSRWIKLFTPISGEIISRQFSVTGVANVFEGNVRYQLATSEGEKLVDGFTTGAMGDWGYFSFDMSLSDGIESGTFLLLELFTESPKDGTIQDLVQLDLVIE